MRSREAHISAYESGNEPLTEPPERILKVSVIGGRAFLDVQALNEDEVLGEVEATVQVPAKSLLRTLQALVEDERDTEVR